MKKATLTDIVFTIILVFGVFTGFYLWIFWNASESGITLDSKYTDSFNQLNTSQNRLNNNMQNIQGNFSSLTEVGGLEFAMNGLKGMLGILLTFVDIIDIGRNSYDSLGNLVELPTFIRILLGLSVIAIIILVIVSILKGDQQKI